MDPRLQKVLDDYDVIFLTKSGAHLYGTETEASDTDYKGIYIPKKEDILLGNVKNSLNFDSNPGKVKNTSEDIDVELYSLQFFIKNAKAGETNAIDLLHAMSHADCVVFSDYRWELIYRYRHYFYTSKMKAFVGYARKQAAKYGEKGARLESAQKLLNFLNTAANPEDKMLWLWDDLPEDEYMYRADDATEKIRTFFFCGKQIQNSAKIQYAIDMVRVFMSTYGARAKKAFDNNGNDWKAVSHALRAAYQIKEIFKTNDLKFPLTEAAFVRNVKQGKIDAKLALAALEHELNQVDEIAKNSKLPNSVPEETINGLVMEVITITHF